VLVLVHDVIVGQEDGIKVEALQAALMHGGNGPAMPGDPDEPHETLLPCFDRRVQRPAWSHRQVPVIGVKQGVQLNQIDRIDLQAFERAMNLVTRVLVEALPGLGGEEEMPAMPRHPWANTQFSVPIAGRDVDMIDAVFEEDVEHTVRLCLSGAAERRRAKERDGTQVSGASKRSFLNHGVFLSCAGSCHMVSYWQTTGDQ